MTKKILPLLSLFLFLSTFSFAQSKELDSYNVVWKSPGKNASESMPCGGGDIGLNVWVEKGDLLIYIARSGNFDENNALLKSGRLRIHLSPNIFEGNHFIQELHLQQGYLTVTAKSREQKQP